MAVVHSISVYYLKITLAQYNISQSLFTHNQNDLVLKSAVQLQAVIVWIHNTMNWASVTFHFHYV